MDLSRGNMGPYSSLDDSAPFAASTEPTVRGRAKILRIFVVIFALCFLAAGAVHLHQYGTGLLVANEEKSIVFEETPRQIIPFDGPLVSNLEQFGGEHRERLHWGTYRPFAYLGIRSRVPKSLLAGMMWAAVQNEGTVLRHYCQDSDDLIKWGWERHDGSTFGRQRLVDSDFTITTYFLRSREQTTGYGGDWAVRVRVEEKENSNKIEQEKSKQSIFFYVGEEGGDAVNLWPVSRSNSGDRPFAGGHADEIGDWQLYAKYKEGVTMDYVGLRQLFIPNLTDSVRNILQAQANSGGSFQLPNNKVDKSNIAIIQISGTLPLEVDFTFVSGLEVVSAESLDYRINNLSGSSLDEKLAHAEGLFDQRFAETFKLDGKNYDEGEVETSKVALSNLLGGIGYFYGQSRIAIPAEEADLAKNIPYWLYWNASLYTAVPARSTYPRGFLWDEGFHELVISRWDRNISLEIIANWMDLMNIDGWIPREQILGDESRSKVPVDYINQQTHDANPPALLLVLKSLAEAFEKDKKENRATIGDIQFFQTVFPRLERWFDWFNTSQVGKEETSYYWRGRADTDEKLNPPTLSSGMDDYPRASHPSDDERHIDIRCWIQHAADILAFIAGVIDDPSAEKFKTTSEQLSNFTRLNELHYDEASSRYYDYGNHTEEVYMKMTKETDPVTGLSQIVERRIVMEPPKLGWVPQFGLNNLYPLIMHIIPTDSSILEDYLEMIADPSNMWTDVGLRSLGSTRGGPYQDKAGQLYNDLRKAVIRNIVQQYNESGFLWEHYDNMPEGKGQGQGVHPFTGWTSLVILMLAEVF